VEIQFKLESLDAIKQVSNGLLRSDPFFVDAPHARNKFRPKATVIFRSARCLLPSEFAGLRPDLKDELSQLRKFSVVVGFALIDTVEHQTRALY